MRYLISSLLATLCTLMLGGCCNKTNTYHIEPYPNHIEPRSGSFALSKSTSFAVSEGCTPEQRCAMDALIAQLSKVTGNNYVVKETGADITFINDSTIASEGYVIDADTKSVKVMASTAQGMFYAIQTLYQLMPAEVLGKQQADGVKWNIQCVKIVDEPRFAYRGMHLDEGRHFFGVEHVKKYLDMMALHKINTFHWHLTEDQGWRIEIKKYPKLTEIGSIRKKTMVGRNWDIYDNTPYGGFYTQEQIREVVEYAAARHITVIPEVDLPGHMLAALTCYPELGCTGGPYEVSGQWGVREDVLCAGKEQTLRFVEDVLSEVIELFPSKYIHIGGDECPKVRWEKCPTCQAKIRQIGAKDDDKFKKEHYLQSYFICKVEEFLNGKGRKIIGWEEILEGGISPNATLMSWLGVKSGVEAANQGHDVIMVPNGFLYFDYAQSPDTIREPVGMRGDVNIRKVYNFEPVTEDILPDKAAHVIGVQANLWTEYIKDVEHMEYMYLPRMTALSELQWTKPENKDFDRFMSSMVIITKRFDVMGYNYAKHVFDVIPTYVTDSVNATVTVQLKSYSQDPIHYTLDGSEPGADSPRYTAPIEINSSCTLKAKAMRPDCDYTLTESFGFNKATCKPITLNSAPHEKYKSDGGSVIVNGRRGTLDFRTGHWLGFYGKPMDITIDLGKATECKSAKISALSRMNDWLFPPAKIEVFGSKDGTNFDKVAELATNDWKESAPNQIFNYICNFEPQVLCSLRIVAYAVEQIPQWHAGKDTKAYLFVDEVTVD